MDPATAAARLGTLANIAVIGAVVDALLNALPEPRALVLRMVMFGVGVVLNAVATGLYIGAGLGAGPRDGLTTALAARGRSIRVVRTGIELSALAVGWLLGGNVGIGTLAYAVGIGPLVHVMIPLFGRKDSRMRSGEFAGEAGKGGEGDGDFGDAADEKAARVAEAVAAAGRGRRRSGVEAR